MAWRHDGALLAVLTLTACGSSIDNMDPSGGGGTASGTNTGTAAGTGTGTGAGGSTPSAGCENGTALAGDETITVMHGGVERSYNLHLPPSYDGSTELPLVLNFHGFTSDPGQQALFSGMSPHADANGYAVAYPQGIGNSWNGGAICCGDAAAMMVDDVDFARLVVADIASRACIDQKRVYSTGMSNGGFMSHRLACEASDLVAAIAPVDGILGIPNGECNPSRNVPIIHFYGTEDPLVQYSWAQLANEFWVGHHVCGEEPPEITTEVGAATCETWSACAEGAQITFCSIEGMGHCWPGQAVCPASLGEANTDLSANEHMWAFFQQFSL